MQSKQKDQEIEVEFIRNSNIDAATDLASAMLRRCFGPANDEEIKQLQERVLMAKMLAQQEMVDDYVDDVTLLAKKQNPHREEGPMRGPRIGTNLGDLLRKALAKKGEQDE